MSIDHYENFPVASLVLPPHLREPITAIYHVLRYMDDIADEGNDPPPIRQQKLEACCQALKEIQAGKKPTDFPFTQLAPVMATYPLPVTLFWDMISAFQQDTIKNRYKNYPQLLDYCTRSANPVGRMMLILFNCQGLEAIMASDHICTALQLVNFWQDVKIDREKNRCYIPLSILNRYQLTLDDLQPNQQTSQWREMMSTLIKDTQKRFLLGADLPQRLTGRIRLELCLIIQGGWRMTEKVAKQGYDTRMHRPTLNLADWLIIFYRTIRHTKTIERFRRLYQDDTVLFID